MFEVCTTNFGNLNRPHFSSQIFTNKIANQVFRPNNKQLFYVECDRLQCKLNGNQVIRFEKKGQKTYKNQCFFDISGI